MNREYSYMNGIIHNIQNVQVGDKTYVNLNVRVQDDMRHLLQDHMRQDVVHHIQVSLPSSYLKEFSVNDAVEMKIDKDGFLADIREIGPQIQKTLLRGVIKHECYRGARI
ncbi:MAG: hypothetical protein IJG63_03405 [Oscillospiraceae bacterium]|nr:hypothetical protein [Oscillospiraceae bacterium]